MVSKVNPYGIQRNHCGIEGRWIWVSSLKMVENNCI